MDFPGIAYRTYQQWKNHPTMSSFFFSVLRKIQGHKDPVKRARELHEVVDQCVDRIFEDQTVIRSVSCKVGCSGCCHTPVSVSSDEAALLAKRVEEGVEISFQKLEKQAIMGNSSLNYYALSFENRGCVFLSENGKCKVYDDRPSVCRTNFVVGDPKQCDTSDGKEKPVRLLNTVKADMAIIAGYKSSASSGLLPNMLMNALSKKQNKSISPLIRKDTIT